MWADHGDDVSIQYSGTPALKGDFVRYTSMDLICTWELVYLSHAAYMYAGTRIIAFT